MTHTSKRFEFTASVDAAGALHAEGGAPLEPPDGWTPDHLLLAALVRCSLGSLRYHARRGGLGVEGAGSAHGVVARRAEDGRFALVRVAVELDVEIDPPPEPEALPGLLAKAERDCFVGASLTARPSYAWTVNGSRLDDDRKEATTRDAA